MPETALVSESVTVTLTAVCSFLKTPNVIVSASLFTVGVPPWTIPPAVQLYPR
jgi:hypothetical protein